ncbi:MAG: hypothetical protein K2J20_00535, partial [Bacilli bacterium]|nr:hypothetical protein [Bacilli bacterium]
AFNSTNNLNYRFIALTEDMWQKERQVYIDNVKNKKTYEYIEEVETPKLEESEDDINTLEKVAFDIFDSNKIEIE